MRGYYSIASFIAENVRQHVAEKHLKLHDGTVTIQFVADDKPFVKNYLGEEAENACYSFSTDVNRAISGTAVYFNTAKIIGFLDNCTDFISNVMAITVKSNCKPERRLYRIVIAISDLDSKAFENKTTVQKCFESAFTNLPECINSISGEYCAIDKKLY